MRYRKYLRQRYRALFGYTAFIWLCIGLLIASPLLLTPFFEIDGRTIVALLAPGVGLTAISFPLWRRLRPANTYTMTVQEGAVVVILSWGVALLVGSTPFLISSDLTFTQALFESTSGWTTTGLSVVDVTATHPLILLYRSTTQFAGGAGFAIIMLTLISGIAGAGVTSAEGRQDQLVPHVRRSASIVLRLYISYAIAGAFALFLAGMSWFDALNHAFAALSTGGFSTRAASIGYWDNPLIELIVIVLMLLGTTSFLTAYAVVNGRWQELFRNSEMRLIAIVLLSGILVLFGGVAWNTYPTMSKAMRVAIFEVTSAVSTCGFATVGYSEWPALGWVLFIILMLIGGGSGSTAGGIKQARILILGKGFANEIRRSFASRHALLKSSMWHGERRIFLNDADFRRAAVFILTHLSVFTAGVLILTAYNVPLANALFEFASSISTIGLSVGVTTADAPPGILWTQIAGMVLGRLEFFTVFVGVGKLLGDGRFWLRASV